MATRTHETNTEEELQIPAKIWASVLLIPWAFFMHSVYAGIAVSGLPSGSWQYSWALTGFLVSIPGSFLILLRSQRPQFALIASAIMTIAFPLSPLQCQILTTAVIARKPHARPWAIPLMLAVTLIGEGKDLARGVSIPQASLWYASQTNNPDPHLLVSLATAALVTFAGVAICITAGHMMSERASRAHAEGNLQRERTRATKLQNEIDARVFSEAVARETHDTLAHSLSVLALQSVTLASHARTLADRIGNIDVYEFPDLRPKLVMDAEAISQQASQLRALSAGALNEAHTVIDMLRNPEVTLKTLSLGNEEAALTRSSLGKLIEQARESGFTIDSWIDVSSLSQLSPTISTLAYRVIQEGLSNAIRYSSVPRAQLEVIAEEHRGVIINVINPVSAKIDPSHSEPTTSQVPATANDALGDMRTQSTNTYSNESRHSGHGLIGIEERIRSCSGRCTWGEEDGKFILRVNLPWVHI